MYALFHEILRSNLFTEKLTILFATQISNASKPKKGKPPCRFAVYLHKQLGAPIKYAIRRAQGKGGSSRPVHPNTGVMVYTIARTLLPP